MSQDTSQKQRIPEALQPDYFKVDDRSLFDLYQDAQKLAEALLFYDISSKDAVSTWSAFFESASNYIQKITPEGEYELPSGEESGQCPPHLGLFLSFLKLFSHSQDQLNQLTAAHLHFFYHKILGQKKKGVKPDKVFVFFGLARNVTSYLLPRGLQLKAGKDADGNEIQYTSDRDLFINHAKISQFKAISHTKKSDSVIYAFPIVDSADGLGKPLEEGEGWYPFGNTRKRFSTATIGFGIGSRMLFLKEGNRRIQLSFLLSENNINSSSAEIKNLAPEEFKVLLSGGDQWFLKALSSIRLEGEKLMFTIELNETDPPVSPFNLNIAEDPVTAIKLPVVKILLHEGVKFSRYVFIQSLQFSKIDIKVTVDKAHNLIVRNDYGDLDPKRAFQPFGFSPLIGSNLFLAFEETFYKPISTYSLKIKWKGLPEDMKAYYEGYSGEINSLVKNEKDFKVKASIRYKRTWIELKNKVSDSDEFSLFENDLHFDLENFPKEKVSNTQEFDSEDGLIRLTLSSPKHAFGHHIYPTVYAKAIMGQLQDKASPIPNEPYTPIIDAMELSYTAEESTDLLRSRDPSFQFFHLEPFGIHIKILKNENPFHSLSLLSDEFLRAGNLYMGIENFKPSQQLTIFFKIATENMDNKPDLIFHFLGRLGWVQLSEDHILSDTTLGLKQTGILVLNLPADLSDKNERMPVGLHWLRLSVTDNPENFDKILNVRTHVVTCSLNYYPALEELEVNNLPPNSIKSFSKKIAEIKKIEQPYTSFGGRSAEKNIQYFTRVSEKLNHKMRGITSWDMERLILEQFPDIYKVKCIQHADTNGNHVPGSIHIIVIPFIRKFDKVKILKPMVPNSTLIEIREYISRLSSPHASFTVTNPNYEEIKIVTAVNFHIQVDAGFYLKQLNTDLQHFLSPWAFREDVEIPLGSRLYRSSIIEFIESRHYVNFIASIKLLKNNKEIQDIEINPDERSIIVSADLHKIEAIESKSVLCQTNQGIEQMIVDVNFEIQ